MELDYLEWEAGHGRHALALMDGEHDETLLAVARIDGSTIVSGWPWRWQVARVGGADAGVPGITSEDAARFERLLVEASEGARVRVHLPFIPDFRHTGLKVGQTILLPLGDTDDESVKKVTGNKRREARKALKAGWSVEVADGPGAYRRFAELQRETEARRGTAPGAPLPENPDPGESWREWEHPWQWLLVARKDGDIGAGSGFGRSEGGMLDYRANASTPDALAEGANALLAMEAIERGREAGYTFINWGGSTTFKRSLGGARIDTWELLTGMELWGLPNRLESLWRQTRSDAAARIKKLGERGKTRRR
jgi:hypothetical protein